MDNSFTQIPPFDRLLRAYKFNERFYSDATKEVAEQLSDLGRDVKASSYWLTFFAGAICEEGPALSSMSLTEVFKPFVFIIDGLKRDYILYSAEEYADLCEVFCSAVDLNLTSSREIPYA